MDITAIKARPLTSYQKTLRHLRATVERVSTHLGSADSVDLSAGPGTPILMRQVSVGRFVLHTATGAVVTLAGPLAGFGLGALAFGIMGGIDGMREGAQEVARECDDGASAVAGAVVGGVFGGAFGAIGGGLRGALVGVIGGLAGPVVGAFLGAAWALWSELRSN